MLYFMSTKNFHEQCFETSSMVQYFRGASSTNLVFQSNKRVDRGSSEEVLDYNGVKLCNFSRDKLEEYISQKDKAWG